jgi:hypothetical protein
MTIDDQQSKSTPLWDLVKSMIHTQKIQQDDFFSNEVVGKANDCHDIDYQSYIRLSSIEEKQTITPEAFSLMLFWLKNEEISLDFFERFMTILVSFADKMKVPIDEESLPCLVEMIGLVQYKDHAIYTALELYVESPFSLRKPYEVVL